MTKTITSVIERSDGALTVKIPFKVKRFGGKKKIRFPDGTTIESSRKNKTMQLESFSPLQLALAKGHEWQSLLDSGEVASFKELAKRFKVDHSYVSRVVNLTLLPPHVIQLILSNESPICIPQNKLALNSQRLWK